MATASSLSSAPSLPSGPNVAHFFKFTEINFLNWTCQMRPFFIDHDLFSHINGSSSAPDPKLPADTITWESDGPLYLYIPLCNYDGWRPGAITLFRG
ncbi:hypothetical protein ACFX1Z_010414 [Malus domestica]